MDIDFNDIFTLNSNTFNTHKKEHIIHSHDSDIYSIYTYKTCIYIHGIFLHTRVFKLFTPIHKHSLWKLKKKKPYDYEKEQYLSRPPTQRPTEKSGHPLCNPRSICGLSRELLYETTIGAKGHERPFL